MIELSCKAFFALIDKSEYRDIVHFAQMQQAAPECEIQAEKLLPADNSAIVLAMQSNPQRENKIPKHSPQSSQPAAMHIVSLELLHLPRLLCG